jgi:hypothetical protein
MPRGARVLAMVAKSELFNAFWFGKPLSALHWACLASFIDKGHGVDLYAYQDLEVPPGVNLIDASRVLPASAVFFFPNPDLPTPDLGPFSDVFRFKLLAEKGGWWVDVDVFCNRRQFPECRYAWAAEFPPEPGARPAIGTSQIKFPKDDPMIRRLRDECAALARVMTQREEIGPHLISRVIHEHGAADDHFGSIEQFYPMKWIEGFKLWLPEFRDEVLGRVEQAYFVACWASLASYMGIDPNRRPPVGSYLDGELERLAADRLSAAPALTADEIRTLVRRWFADKDWAVSELSAVTSAADMKRLALGSGAPPKESPPQDSAANGAASGNGAAETETETPPEPAPSTKEGTPSSDAQTLAARLAVLIGELSEIRAALLGEAASFVDLPEADIPETISEIELAAPQLNRLQRCFLALFTQPLVEPISRTLIPFAEIIPGVRIGFGTEDSPLLTIAPKSDPELSPEAYLNSLRFVFATWMSLEVPLEAGDLAQAQRYQFGLSAVASRHATCRLFIRRIDGDRLNDTVLKVFHLQPNERHYNFYGDISSDESGGGGQTLLILTVESGRGMSLELNYLSVYFA